MELIKKQKLIEEVNKVNLKNSLFSLIKECIDGENTDRFYIFKEDVLLMDKSLKFLEQEIIESEFETYYFKTKKLKELIKKGKIIECLKLFWDNKKLVKNCFLLEKFKVFYNRHNDACCQITPEAYYRDKFKIENKGIEDNDNLLDFINHIIINGSGFSYKDYEKFKILINEINVSKIKEEDNILISYIHPNVLSHFINLLSGVIRSPQQNIKTDVKNDKFIKIYEKFIKLIIKIDPSLFINSYLYTGYLDIYLNNEILKIIKDELNTNHSVITKISQANSHTTQGKYLYEIIQGNFNFNGLILNPITTGPNNPYCRPYFYGDSTPSNSIEQRFKIIEQHFCPYVASFNTKVGKNISLNDKVCFLISYIRTPAFITQLYLSFKPLHETYQDEVWAFQQNMKEKEGRKFLKQSFTNNESIKFIKIIQIKLLEILLSYLEKYKGLIDPNEQQSKNDILKEIQALSKNRELSVFYRCKQVQDFLNYICFRIHDILNSEYEIHLKDVDLKLFSNNFFIPRMIGEQTLFNNKEKVAFMYFPMTSKKLIIFINKQVAHPIDVINYINDECMINNVETDEFIVSID